MTKFQAECPLSHFLRGHFPNCQITVYILLILTMGKQIEKCVNHMLKLKTICKNNSKIQKVMTASWKKRSGHVCG